MQREIHEECGVFGVYAKRCSEVGALTYYGLYALQHRGQESCGIVVCDDGVFTSHKDVGLVNEVFSGDTVAKLGMGTMAVGHVRYATTGGNSRANCQPIEVNHQKGKMALAHNGNLTNSYELRSSLELSGAIFHTTSDTETIAYIVTQERLRTPSIEDAVRQAMGRLSGAYSIVLMSATKLIAARDPQGFRPLCYGKTEDGTIVVASESAALAAVAATFERDILPGEILTFDEKGVHSCKEYCNQRKKTTCIFEYIYFARPDSVIDGCSVITARENAGRVLAMTHPAEADIVVGVPDSGLCAARGFSEESHIPFAFGFVKNRYIGRTFISPSQKERSNQVRIKLNPIREVIQGKRVVLIDDSIVRGTTSGQIVALLREAGAREIHLRISSPPFRNPCYYGTDIDSRENLIACQHTMEEIAELLGVDSLAFLDVSNLSRLTGEESYCAACFSGVYPTSLPTDTRKDRFEERLSVRNNSNT